MLKSDGSLSFFTLQSGEKIPSVRTSVVHVSTMSEAVKRVVKALHARLVLVQPAFKYLPQETTGIIGRGNEAGK